MAEAFKSVDISKLPQVVRLAEQVARSGKARILRRKDRELAILAPIPRVKRTSARGRPFTFEDSLWKIIGIGNSGLTDVSENKHKYLAEAYADTHDHTTR